jgi:hypothetical protein
MKQQFFAPAYMTRFFQENNLVTSSIVSTEVGELYYFHERLALLVRTDDQLAVLHIREEGNWKSWTECQADLTEALHLLENLGARLPQQLVKLYQSLEKAYEKRDTTERNEGLELHIAQTEDMIEAVKAATQIDAPEPINPEPMPTFDQIADQVHAERLQKRLPAVLKDLELLQHRRDTTAQADRQGKQWEALLDQIRHLKHQVKLAQLDINQAAGEPKEPIFQSSALHRAYHATGFPFHILNEITNLPWS